MKRQLKRTHSIWRCPPQWCQLKTNPRRGFLDLAHRKATSLRGGATVGTLAKKDSHPRSRVLEPSDYERFQAPDFVGAMSLSCHDPPLRLLAGSSPYGGLRSNTPFVGIHEGNIVFPVSFGGRRMSLHRKILVVLLKLTPLPPPPPRARMRMCVGTCLF